MRIFMKFFDYLWHTAFQLNKKNILDLIDSTNCEKLCDLGCDDGVWTMQIAKRANSTQLYGIEIVPEQAKKSQLNGIDVTVSDLNQVLPYRDNFFDLVHANQVIEHLADVDMFISEIHRILKVGGYAVISTENASSWHNIIASILGWQIFSLTNVSAKASGIGNPLAIHRGNMLQWSSWTHKTIFNYLGLIEIFELYRFKIKKIKGAGYYPFSSHFGKIDVRHSHFITIKVQKL